MKNQPPKPTIHPSPQPSFFRTGVELLAVFILAYLCLKPIWRSAVFTIYQARDIQRAYEVLKGHFIFFGPEATGGGYLPGGLYYYLIAGPLGLGLGWMGVFRLMLVLHSAAATLIWYIFRSRASRATALLAAAFYLGASDLTLNISHFMNSSFLPFFATLLTLTLLKLFDKDEHKNDFAISPNDVGAMLLALSLQIHFTSIIYLLTFLVLVVMRRRLDIKFNTNKVRSLFSVILFLALLSPYFIWNFLKIKGHNFGISPEPVGGSDWGASALTLFKNEIDIGLSNFDGLATWHRLVDLMGAPETIWTFAALIYCSRRLPPQFVGPHARGSLFYRIILIAMGFALMPALFHLNVGWALRYSMSFQILLAFVVGAVGWRLEKTEANRNIWIACFLLLSVLAIYLKSPGGAEYFSTVLTNIGSQRLITIITFSFLSTLALNTGMLRKRISPALLVSLVTTLLALKISAVCTTVSQQPNLMTIDRMQQVAQIIHGETGWDFRQARERIFLVNVTNFYSFANLFDELKTPMAVGREKINADGYFVALKKDGKGELGIVDLADWFKKNHLEPSILDEIESGSLKLKISYQKGPLLIVAYKFIDPIRLGDHFQNIGLPYEDISHVATDAKNKNLFAGEINNCPQLSALCRNEITLRESADSSGPKKLELTVRGNVLAQPSNYSIPQWTEGWVNPYLDIACSQQHHRVKLANALGLVNRQITSNNEIYSPFTRTFENPCQDGKIRQVQFGYDAAAISTFLKPIKLEAKSIDLTASQN